MKPKDEFKPKLHLCLLLFYQIYHFKPFSLLSRDNSAESGENVQYFHWLITRSTTCEGGLIASNIEYKTSLLQFIHEVEMFFFVNVIQIQSFHAVTNKTLQCNS